MYGINGVLLAGAVGLIRVLCVKENIKVQSVCTDQVVNATLVVLWEIVKNSYVN